MAKECLGARYPLKSRSHPPKDNFKQCSSFFDDSISNKQLRGPKVLQKDLPILQSCEEVCLPSQKSYKYIK